MTPAELNLLIATADKIALAVMSIAPHVSCEDKVHLEHILEHALILSDRWERSRPRAIPFYS